MIRLFAFVAAMWALMLAGGGAIVALLGPAEISGFGEHDAALTSGAKAAIAVLMVAAWVLVLTGLKNWIFRSQIRY